MAQQLLLNAVFSESNVLRIIKSFLVICFCLFCINILFIKYSNAAVFECMRKYGRVNKLILYNQINYHYHTARAEWEQRSWRMLKSISSIGDSNSGVNKTIQIMKIFYVHTSKYFVVITKHTHSYNQWYNYTNIKYIKSNDKQEMTIFYTERNRIEKIFNTSIFS